VKGPRRTVRRILVLVMAAMLVAGSFAGVRAYRRSLWGSSSDTWLATCSRGLESTTGAAIAQAICTCQLDYISARWTPASYSLDVQRTQRSMQTRGVIDDCIDLAAGYSKKRP